ncbi:MAG: hypothetical protein AB1Z98_27040, partial [Nannocystaceae bacterium]
AAARKAVKRYGALPVPLTVRNAVTDLMKDVQYGVGYRYPHDLSGGVDREHGSYLPDALVRRQQAGDEPPLVEPSPRGWEGRAAAELARRRAGTVSEPAAPRSTDRATGEAANDSASDDRAPDVTKPGSLDGSPGDG